MGCSFIDQCFHILLNKYILNQLTMLTNPGRVLLNIAKKVMSLAVSKTSLFKHIAKLSPNICEKEEQPLSCYFNNKATRPKLTANRFRS